MVVLSRFVQVQTWQVFFDGSFFVDLMKPLVGVVVINPLLRRDICNQILHLFDFALRIGIFKNVD